MADEVAPAVPAATPEVDCSEAERPVRGFYRSPQATYMVDGVGFVADAPLLEAARSNRMLALQRIRDARWAALPKFRDVSVGGAFHAGESVSDVHGDADFDRQGPERQAYEILSLRNELLPYASTGALHVFHRRLYAWALRFRVGSTETFVVAANNFGRLRRLWTCAVFLECDLADRLDVPIAEDPGMGGYLTMLADEAYPGNPPPDLDFGPSLSDLPQPFRAPTTSIRFRRSNDLASIERRGLLAPAWASSLVRARPFFDLKRWIPCRPSWWTEYGPFMETPVALSYVATRLTEADNAAWGIVFDEFFCFVLAAWVHWLVHDGLFCRLSDQVVG